MNPEQRANLAVSQVDDQMVVLDREAGQIHQLNGVARFVWECCDGKTSQEEMVSRLQDVYDVSREVAEEDVATVIGQFRELGLLLPADN